jgi:flagellar FliL protein
MANAAPSKPAEEEDDEESGEGTTPPAPKSVSLLAFIAIMAILTALGVGSGGLLGLHLQGKMESLAASKPESAGGSSAKGAPAPAVGLKPLAPIVANLSGSAHTWIRLEAALVMEGDQSPEAKMLAAQITEDIVAYLRTVPLAQVEGASGFQHLREDLNDRMRVRSGGKIQDLIIQALIIE